LLLLVAAGCDPVRPQAQGTISLDAGVDPTNFARLCLRTFADPMGAFVPALPISVEDAEDGRDEPLAGVKFPRAYWLGGSIGTAAARDRRLVAWLSRSANGPVDRVAPGEVFCTTTFQAPYRYGDNAYGGPVGHVDCTLSSIAP
jgi:hypothetical protein